MRVVLVRYDVDFNHKQSSDRSLVEIYFDRMGRLWTILFAKYVWSETMYDAILILEVAFTNLHIIMHSLRDNYC